MKAFARSWHMGVIATRRVRSGGEQQGALVGTGGNMLPPAALLSGDRHRRGTIGTIGGIALPPTAPMQMMWEGHLRGEQELPPLAEP